MASRISFSKADLRAPCALGATFKLRVTSRPNDGGENLQRRALAAIGSGEDTRPEGSRTGHVTVSVQPIPEFAEDTVGADGAEDPVTLSAHGWTSIPRVGALECDQDLKYGSVHGLRVAGTRSHFNWSISQTASLNDASGASQHLEQVSFTVSTRTLPMAAMLRPDATIVGPIRKD